MFFSSHPINRWCGDHEESDLGGTSNPTSEITLLEPLSTKSLTTFLMTVKTGARTSTPSIYVFFAGQWGSSPVIHLNQLTTRTNLFEPSAIDEFTFTIPDTGVVINEIFSIESITSSLARCDAYLEYRRSRTMDM